MRFATRRGPSGTTLTLLIPAPGETARAHGKTAGKTAEPDAPREGAGFLPPLRFGEGGRGGEVFCAARHRQTSPPNPLSEAERGNRTLPSPSRRVSGSAYSFAALPARTAAKRVSGSRAV